MTRDPFEGRSLDELLGLAEEKYNVVFETLKVGDVSLEFLQIADMERLIDELAERSEKENIKLELPLWAKIWPASLILAHYIRRIDKSSGNRLLEIGSGVGVSGLFAAAFGFRTVLSDINPDALLFCRINALKNGLQDMVQVVRADYSSDRLKTAFNYIIGSEVLYREDDYRGLVKFLLAHLEPNRDACAVLVKDYLRKAGKFFHLAEKEFHIRTQEIGFKSTEKGEDGRVERFLATVCRLEAKKTC